MKQCFILSIMLIVSLQSMAAVKVTEWTVIDTDTSLEWQLDNPGKMRWRDGINYCKALSLNGHSDWRLPDKTELESGSLLAKHFPDLKPVYFWTSTDYEPDREQSWVVNLLYGFVAYDNGGYSYNIKCVRTLN
jgi:hypothetical protein